MATKKTGDELEKFKEYFRSKSNEDAKRHLLYPLFQREFKYKFKIESDTNGAEIYVTGHLLVESKTDYSHWLEGFYQLLHYHRKYGLAYNTIMVIVHQFVGNWKVNHLPESVLPF